MNKIFLFLKTRKWMPYILGSLLIILFMFIQMLYYKQGTETKNLHIINGLFYASTIQVMIYSYITSKFYTLNQLSLGFTRKQIYFDFLKRILIGTLMIICIYTIYHLFNLMINKDNSLWSFKIVLRYFSIYILYASIGYILGLIKCNKKEDLLIKIFVICLILILFYINTIVNTFVSIILIILAIIILLSSFEVIYTIQIKE